MIVGIPNRNNRSFINFFAPFLSNDGGTKIGSNEKNKDMKKAWLNDKINQKA